jgi:hypothetical protein
LLNPDGFQRIMEEIKHQQEKGEGQGEVESRGTLSPHQFEQLDRKVDELEFDPLFAMKKKESEEAATEKK